MTIVVRNWEKFQHADVTKRGRAATWVKNYTALLSDEAYLNLTGHRRGILHCIWLEYARSRARLPADTRSLTLRFNMRVTAADLAALRVAGFIEYEGEARSKDAVRAVARRSRSGHDTVTTRASRAHETVMTTDDPLNHAAGQEIRHAAVTPPSRLEEKREEHELRDRSSREEPLHVGRFDPDELEAWQPPDEDQKANVVQLDERKPRAEINGKSLDTVIGPLLDDLRARGSP